MVMLTTQQQALIKAIEELELAQVQKLLAEGLDPNFIDPEQGPPVSMICDGIFKWWENVSEAYEAGTPLSKEEKQQSLQVYLDILEALIQAKANVHLWDAEEFYGPLWDAASSAQLACGGGKCASALRPGGRAKVRKAPDFPTRAPLIRRFYFREHEL